jgi:hypothetical protein
LTGSAKRANRKSPLAVDRIDKLMLGIAIENQGLTGALLRDRAEKIVNDVVSTRDDWQ